MKIRTKHSKGDDQREMRVGGPGGCAVALRMDVTADRMATDERSFSAHGLAARERCHAACFVRRAWMSRFTETLQESLPRRPQPVFRGQVGDLGIGYGPHFTQGEYTRKILSLACLPI